MICLRNLTLSAIRARYGEIAAAQFSSTASSR